MTVYERIVLLMLSLYVYYREKLIFGNNVLHATRTLIDYRCVIKPRDWSFGKLGCIKNNKPRK